MVVSGFLPLPILSIDGADVATYISPASVNMPYNMFTTALGQCKHQPSTIIGLHTKKWKERQTSLYKSVACSCGEGVRKDTMQHELRLGDNKNNKKVFFLLSSKGALSRGLNLQYLQGDLQYPFRLLTFYDSKIKISEWHLVLACYIAALKTSSLLAPAFKAGRNAK